MSDHPMNDLPDGPTTTTQAITEPGTSQHEIARLLAWIDFASELIDAHIWGFRSGDWQAGDALAHALCDTDWPPSFRRDDDDPTLIHIIEGVWPTTSGDADLSECSSSPSEQEQIDGQSNLDDDRDTNTSNEREKRNDHDTTRRRGLQ